ncbi:LacI family transcriptional regulator [Klebsiella pneumoniae]|uniref:LacI family transcriptional regulator n=1 Tax=Paenibacillus antri TaxID=2582848 RepID=A0A5R9G8B2_9BACL|nr:LacI family DNA-binding transcriptional regulator [Paenibacillus antri]TLS52642.1 LacI family transcriptional regulator [Paenibacillus antri]TMY87573.1 LacI family transcriptional regulator [Klebsiella pneumoniae]
MAHTLESIAELAGVSRGTVSRVVNGQPGVKPNVRERVLAVIERTGYVPNPQARSLAGGKTGNIGVVVFGDKPDFLKHHIFFEALQGIQEQTASNDYDLLLYANRKEADAEYWKRIATKRKTDGLIIMGERIQPEYLHYYRQRGIPYVLIGKRVFGSLPLACVASDYRSGAYRATKHLLERGRRRIAYIQGLPDMHHENERFAGYCEALREAGLDMDPSLIIAGRAEREEAVREMRLLLKRQASFDAVFAANDLMALGAMDVLLESGRSVPEDVAVAGYDDIAQSRHASPPLTTVRQEKEKLGKEAASLLFDMLRGALPADASKDVVIENDLIVRAST